MMLLRWLGYKAKRQLKDWFPGIMLIMLVINCVCLIIGALAAVLGFQGYNDGRYPANAVDAVIKCVIGFVITVWFWIPLAYPAYKEKRDEYLRWKEDWYHDKYNPHA